MKNKTVIKTKICVSGDEKTITIYRYKKVFWFFGYWVWDGNIHSSHKLNTERIVDSNVSNFLLDQFIFKINENHDFKVIEEPFAKA